MGVPALLHPYRSVWHDEVTGEGAGLRIRLAIADNGWGTPEGLRYIAGPKHFVGTHDSNFLSRSLVANTDGPMCVANNACHRSEDIPLSFHKDRHTLFKLYKSLGIVVTVGAYK